MLRHATSHVPSLLFGAEGVGGASSALAFVETDDSSLLERIGLLYVSIEHFSEAIAIAAQLRAMDQVEVADRIEAHAHVKAGEFELAAGLLAKLGQESLRREDVQEDLSAVLRAYGLAD